MTRMPAAERSDLIAAAQTGDPAAIARLLAACQGDIRRYARRHCLASDVDDAVQESLLAVTRHIASLKAVAAFAGWLLTMARRECQRLARRALRHDALDDAEAERRLLGQPDHALRLDIARALESLPAHYRLVVLLRDMEELSIAEIAERLGEAEGAVKSRLHRARGLVREYLLAG